MRTVWRALWALAILPLAVPCAALVAVMYGLAVGAREGWDCLCFLWRNMGPDCMEIAERDLRDGGAA